MRLIQPTQVGFVSLAMRPLGTEQEGRSLMQNWYYNYQTLPRTTYINAIAKLTQGLCQVTI